jgi:hypothetical protein
MATPQTAQSAPPKPVFDAEIPVLRRWISCLDRDFRQGCGTISVELNIRRLGGVVAHALPSIASFSSASETLSARLHRFRLCTYDTGWILQRWLITCAEITAYIGQGRNFRD